MSVIEIIAYLSSILCVVLGCGAIVAGARYIRSGFFGDNTGE